MSEEWFVDGLNVLYHLKSRPGHSASDLPGLARELAGVAAEKSVRIFLVLDGRGPADELAPHGTERLTVLYAQDESADSWIERSLVERRGRSDCVVITSDGAIRNIARGTGARVWKPEELAEILLRSGRERDEQLRTRQAKSHRFNRPFEDKI